MKLLPYLRFNTAVAVLAAGLLAWSVPTSQLHADDETDTPAGTAPVEAPPQPESPDTPAVPEPAVEAIDTPAPQPEPASASDDGPELVRLDELVTVMNDAHLRSDETTPNMVTIMGSAIVDGVVNGDCVTVMGNVTVNGKVRGDLVCVMGQITLGPGAEVRGQAVAVGGGMRLDPTARIRGEKVAITIPGIGGSFGGWLGEWFRDGLGKARILPHNHSWAWGAAIVFLGLNLLFAAVFGGAVRASARALETRPVLSFVNGALVLLLFPVLLVLLCASVVGILLVPVATAGLFLCWFLGTIGVFYFCGQQFGMAERPVAAVLVGNLIFLALYALPIIGFAVWSVTGLMGLGAAVTAMGNKRRETRAAQKAATPPVVPPAPPPPLSFTPQVQATPATPVYGTPPAPPMSQAPTMASPGFFGATAGPTIATADTPGAAAAAAVPPYSGWNPPAPTPEAASLPPLPVDVTIERAPFWPRLGALTLDFIFVAIVCAFISGNPPLMLLLLVAYHVAFWSWRATTPGGIVFNLRIVRLDRSPITPAVAIVRALGGVFSMLPAGLGFIWVSFDDERQAWHDKLAGTVVERVSRTTPLI